MRTAAEEVKARGARVYVITDKASLADGIDANPILISNNGPLTALGAVLPLQVSIIHPILIPLTLLLYSPFTFRIYPHIYLQIY